MQLLEGRRALVTGGGRGIGEGIARRLAAEGAEVTIVSRTLDVAQAVAEEIGGVAVACDIADLDAAQRAVTAAGPLDVLVNNAGFDDPGWFTDTTPERWRRVVGVNLLGMFACTHAALPAMQQAGYGRIVNIGSEAGRIGSSGNAVYAATKGGIVAFTKSIARENARYGITANTIAVGPIETPLMDQVRAKGELGRKMVAAMERGTLLGRLGEPEEVAAMVAFLASEQAGYVTGENIGVSGGMGIGSA
ncbi:SDR family NAD(P)-dependent oxidoreductase [Patulibacter defluvii]|uniref:SDR family NAD(P)-dependent oxidoreductase n=1 Tax=Patulibacter defluvii TaxID=3095358 RepID=UPI002A75A079|nr:SDR family NAD(P)-dependent oxidoreductase [Patulibacter sp. DM4]